MYADYHLHTYFSDDSEYPMEDLIRDAIAAGLDEICFTDHVDYGIKADWPEPSLEYNPAEKLGRGEMNVKYPAYFNMIHNMREKYTDRIAIKQGLEFGVQTHTIPLYQRLYDSYELDFVIMSNHQVGDQEFWTGDYQRGRTRAEFNLGYYKEILDVIKEYKSYSVLGHLDSIVRYDDAGPIDFSVIHDICRDILLQTIADGKGIEVNTSNVRYGLSDMTPSRDILKLYRELGGEIITIGSDAHAPSHLAAYIKDTMEVLKGMGYEYFCTFDRMEPVFHKL